MQDSALGVEQAIAHLASVILYCLLIPMDQTAKFLAVGSRLAPSLQT